MASDGQVTFGNTVVKHAARKIRRLYNERVLAGFAGSAAGLAQPSLASELVPATSDDRNDGVL